jgi:sulfate adenylyltransferase subunit 2
MGSEKINVLNYGIFLMAEKHVGEHFRVFPISNWTEMDVWQYIYQEQIEMPSLYFSHKRKVFERDGVWYAQSEFIQNKPDEVIEERVVRFRTVGDITCTGAVFSEAASLEDIIQEVAASTHDRTWYTCRRQTQRSSYGRS